MQQSGFVNKVNNYSDRSFTTAEQTNKISVLSKNSQSIYGKFEVNRMESHSSNVRISNTPRKTNQSSTRNVYWVRNANKNGQVSNKLEISFSVNNASLKNSLTTRRLVSDSSFDDECELIAIKQLEKSLKNIRKVTRKNVNYKNNFIKMLFCRRRYQVIEP